MSRRTHVCPKCKMQWKHGSSGCRGSYTYVCPECKTDSYSGQWAFVGFAAWVKKVRRVNDSRK